MSPLDGEVNGLPANQPTHTLCYFPVAAGSKRPAFDGWQALSTADEAQVQTWLDQGFNLGLDCGKSGITVIDLDGQEVGEASWRAFCAANGVDPDIKTYTVRTPRGGRHIYFRGRAASSVQKLGPKIDSRGVGGFVLVPPSSTPHGKYEVATPGPHALLPWPITDALAGSTRGAAAVTDELDAPHAIARAAHWLQSREVVEQGNGADARTYEAACTLRDLGISPEKSLELMLEHYRCSPQDERFEAFLERKIESAWAYAQNEPGAWATSDPLRRFAGAALEHTAPDPSPRARPALFTFYDEGEQDGFPDPVDLVESIIQDRATTVLHGVWASLKSFVALDIALAVASGLPAFGHFEVIRPGPVIYLAGEGSSGIAKLRRPAWKAAREHSGPLPFYLAKAVPSVKDEASKTACFDAVHDLIRTRLDGRQPALIVVDTMARAMAGLNENDAGDAGLYLGMAEAMEQEFGCAVLTVAHEGKDSGKSLRGSSAFPAGFDVVLRVEAAGTDTPTPTAQITAPKIKDGGSFKPFTLQGREQAFSGGRSLVMDYRGTGTLRGRTIVTPGQVGRALIDRQADARLCAKAKVLTTEALAMQIAGADADAEGNLVSAIKGQLKDNTSKRFAPYVKKLGGGGRNNGTAWQYPGDGAETDEPGADAE